MGAINDYNRILVVCCVAPMCYIQFITSVHNVDYQVYNTWQLLQIGPGGPHHPDA